MPVLDAQTPYPPGALHGACQNSARTLPLLVWCGQSPTNLKWNKTQLVVDSPIPSREAKSCIFQLGVFTRTNSSVCAHTHASLFILLCVTYTYSLWQHGMQSPRSHVCFCLFFVREEHNQNFLVVFWWAPTRNDVSQNQCYYTLHMHPVPPLCNRIALAFGSYAAFHVYLLG